MSTTTVFDPAPVPGDLGKRMQKPRWTKVFGPSYPWSQRLNSKELRDHTFASPKLHVGLRCVAIVAAIAAVVVYSGRGAVQAWSAAKVAEASRPTGAELQAPAVDYAAQGNLANVLMSAAGVTSDNAQPAATALNAASVTQLGEFAKSILAGKAEGSFMGEIPVTGGQWTKAIMYRKGADDNTVFVGMLLKNVQPGADGTAATEIRLPDTAWLGVAHVDGGVVTVRNLEVPRVRVVKAPDLASVTPELIPRSVNAAFGVAAQR